MGQLIGSSSENIEHSTKNEIEINKWEVSASEDCSIIPRLTEKITKITNHSCPPTRCINCVVVWLSI